MKKVSFLFKVLYILLRECIIPLDGRMRIYKLMEKEGFIIDDENKTIKEIC